MDSCLLVFTFQLNFCPCRLQNKTKQWLCSEEGGGAEARGQAKPLCSVLGMLPRRCRCFRGDKAPSEGRQLHRASGVGWKGPEGLTTSGAVDIGPLCVLTPPANILASHIFCNIPSNCRQAATPKWQEFPQRKQP